MRISGIRNNFVEHNTEDKDWWCLHGEKLEERFVEICKTKLGIDVFINPEKATNRYAHDLISVDKNGSRRIADLKTQNTPFFTAARYNLDPRFAVTFNRKDYERYKSLYPDIVIFGSCTIRTGRNEVCPYSADTQDQGQFGNGEVQTARLWQG